MFRTQSNSRRTSRLLHRTTLPRAPRGPARDPARRSRLRVHGAHGAHGLHAAHADHRRSLKRATLRDCGRRCVYCGLVLELDVATLDHVYPLARGGAHAPGNLVAACGPCNRRKGDMLPHDFFHRYPSAGLNFLAYARVAHRALKRNARRAVSLAMAA